MSVPTHNALWKKFGCTKCDNYPVLILMANFKDDKSVFQTNFIDKNGAEFPCVSKDDGGARFNIVFNNQDWGGPVYLIKPDKTFKKGTGNGDEKDLVSAGIKPHQCGTPVIKKPAVAARKGEIGVLGATGNSLTLNVVKQGTYAITIYSVDGRRLIAIPSEDYTAGLRMVKYAARNIPGGVYIIEIHGSNGVTRQRVICR